MNILYTRCSHVYFLGKELLIQKDLCLIHVVNQ